MNRKTAVTACRALLEPV